jgi:hypothetical protein
MNAKIVTYTGKSFDLLDPQPEMVCIEDIAHSLAYQCRYTGHTGDGLPQMQQFYSVAQHCVLMAEADLPRDPLARLLHDAAETYIGDMARPWKQLLWVSEIREGCTFTSTVKAFEKRIQSVIGLALGVDLSESAEVKLADNRTMATEIRDLMPGSNDWDIPPGVEPLEDVIVPQAPVYAEHSFLSLYRHLKKMEY